MSSTIWSKNLDAFAIRPDNHVYPWLTKPTVLTQALKRVYSTVQVKVLSQQFEAADEDCAQLIGIDQNEKVLIRQIFLVADNVARTYGRVLIPPITYSAYRNVFEQLDVKPIGETLLYGNPDVQRSPFEFGFLSLTDLRVQQIKANLECDLLTKLWARRSVFWLKDLPLLVIEVFLPGLADYDDNPAR